MGIYTRELIGHRLVKTVVLITHQGGVSVFYLKTEHFTLEELCLNGLNSVRFHIVSGGQQWHARGCYISSYNSLDIEAVVAAIIQNPHGEELLVPSNFNSNLAVPEENASDEIIDGAFVAAGLKYMRSHFLPRSKP